MVLVRFQVELLKGFSGLDENDIIEIPWLLGGESRKEEDFFILEFNPDRPDLYSIQGVTRAMRTFKGLESYRKFKMKDSDLEIRAESPKQRPYFSAAIVHNASDRNILASIIDYQEKLHKTIGRDRRLSAIGLHDLSKVKFPLNYREVDRSYGFIPLGEDEEIILDVFMRNNQKASEYGHLVGDKIPAIIDKDGNIISLPPILNSNITSIDENTKDIFVDVTGTDRVTVNKTLALIATSLAYPKGDISTVLINKKRHPEIKESTSTIPTGKLRSILGYDIPAEDIRHSLEKMGYGISDERIIIPPYRYDILHKIDVVEDIVKGIGYNNISMRDEKFVTYGRPNPLRHKEMKLRTVLVGYGLTEVVNNILTNGSFNRIYGFDDEPVRIMNPLSNEQDYIRTRLAPSLMQSLLNNYRNPYPQRIFEIGTVYRDGKEVDCAGIAIAHKEASFSEIKGVFIGLLEDMDVKHYEIEKHNLKMFVNGRLARILVDGKIAGFFGEVYPGILRQIGIKVPVSIGEIDISEVLL